MFSLACRLGLVGYSKEAIVSSDMSQPVLGGNESISLAQKALNRITMDVDSIKISPKIWNQQFSAFSLRNGAGLICQIVSGLV